MEEYKPFDLGTLRGVPDEMVCQILSGVTDIRDVVNVLMTSKAAIRAANKCIREITYDGEDVITVPLSGIGGLGSLKNVASNIVVTVSSVDEAKKIGGLAPAASLLVVVVSERNKLRIGEELVASYMKRALDGSSAGKLRVGFRDSALDITQDTGGHFFLLYGSSLLIGHQDLAGLARVAMSVSPNITMKLISETEDVPEYIDPRDVILGPNIVLSTRLFREFASAVSFGTLDQNYDASQKNPTVKSLLTGIRSRVFRGFPAKLLDLYMYANGLIKYYVDDEDEEFSQVEAKSSDWLTRIKDEYLLMFEQGTEDEANQMFEHVFSGYTVSEELFSQWVDRFVLVLFMKADRVYLRHLAVMETVPMVAIGDDMENDDVVIERSYTTIFKG